MKQRTGRDIFLQHVGRVYADKAPSFYFIDIHTIYDKFIGEIISDVMNELTGAYRNRLGLFSNEIHESIFGDGTWQRKGFRVNTRPVRSDGPTPKDVIDLVKSMGDGQTLAKDRLMIAYSTTNDGFTEHNTRRGLSSSVLNYDALAAVDAAIAEVKPRIDQVRINLTSRHCTADLRFSTDCTVVVCKVDSLPIITLFGNKDDEVYMFAYRDGTYEPINMAQVFQPYARIEYIKESEEKRAYHLYSARDFDVNQLVAFSHKISESAYYSVPTYVEEFTLHDAANTPFNEMLKLAVNVENGLNVFCNSQPNPKKDGIAEEAGEAWLKNAYASLSDNVQPGFSRNGTFIYKSAILNDLVVVSYNLLLEKEKS